MKKIRLLALALSLLLLIGVFTSCKKDADTPAYDSNTDESIADDSQGNDDQGDDGQDSDDQGGDDQGDDDQGGGKEDDETPLGNGDSFSLKALDATFMSFNIKCDTSPDNRTNEVISYILGSGVDIVCTQEVEKIQYDMMQTGLAEKYDTVWYSRQGSDKQGLAITYDKSAWTLVETTRFWLSATPETQSTGWGASYYRICVTALLEHKETGARVNVFNVHLDHQVEAARVNGIKLVLDRAAQSEAPVMICGDFNDRIGSETYKSVSAVLQDAQQTAAVSDEGRTYHNNFAYNDYDGTAIDFCFFTKDVFEINKFEICRDRRTDNNGALSDHYPIKVTLKFIYEYEEFYPIITENGFDGALDT